MTTHCCKLMQKQVDFTCALHDSRYDCPDALISFSSKFREYGLIVHDGGTSSIEITFCPWCGTRLPESLRDRWFAELEDQGFLDPWSQKIPEKYNSDTWYLGD